MSWFTCRCSNRAGYKGNPRGMGLRVQHVVMLFPRGVRINTLVPNNTKVARGRTGVRLSVGSDVPLSPSRWGDYSTDYALFFLHGV